MCACDFCATAVSLSVYCFAQVGTIQRQIGQVDEAVDSFTQALVLQPNSVLALEGAGEAYLAQAHARTSEGLYTAAFDALQKGCVVTRSLLAEGDAGDSPQPSPTREHQNRRVSYCRMIVYFCAACPVYEAFRCASCRCWKRLFWFGGGWLTTSWCGVCCRILFLGRGAQVNPRLR